MRQFQRRHFPHWSILLRCMVLQAKACADRSLLCHHPLARSRFTSCVFVFCPVFFSAWKSGNVDVGSVPRCFFFLDVVSSSLL